MKHIQKKLGLYLTTVIFLLLPFYLNAVVDWSKDEDPERWNSEAKETILNILDRKINKNIAKNLILFLGDGMGVSTVSAGRIRKGQQQGLNGEEVVTHMESFPNLALSKTYNVDSQTPDSAGTATAYLCGVKTRAGIIGLNGRAHISDCQSSFNTKVDSILKWAHKAGKSVGIVTTTRVTHATPAAAYAHSPYREWEAYDGVRFTKETHDQGCTDIAAQLVDNNSFINVVLGGGRSKFLPKTEKDFGQSSNGTRIDKRNLINEWIEKMERSNKTYKFIWNATDFRETNFSNYDHILGLLAYDHMKYEVDRNPLQEPSLTELTLKAIELLKKNKNGYFLLVEGGRIDHGHHENKAKKALDDFVMFDHAIGNATKFVSDEDTMLVVTADHSHTFSFGGYALRGNPIYGIALNAKTNISDSNLTYTSILYANGPGGLKAIRTYNLTNNITENKNYTQESAVYKKQATHSGEDVAVYAKGPMSFLFTNTVEQNFVTHAMAYSACIGPYDNEKCQLNRGILTTDQVASKSAKNSNILIKDFLLLNIIICVFIKYY